MRRLTAVIAAMLLFATVASAGERPSPSVQSTCAMKHAGIAVTVIAGISAVIASGLLIAAYNRPTAQAPSFDYSS